MQNNFCHELDPREAISAPNPTENRPAESLHETETVVRAAPLKPASAAFSRSGRKNRQTVKAGAAYCRPPAFQPQSLGTRSAPKTKRRQNWVGANGRNKGSFDFAQEKNGPEVTAREQQQN